MMHHECIMMRAYGFALACMLGVCAADWFNTTRLFAVLVVCFVLLLFVYRRATGFVMLCTLIFVAGFLRMYNVQHLVDTRLDSRVGASVSLTGIIIREPDRRENSIHYVVDVAESEQHVRMTLRQFPRFAYGDRIQLSGVLEFPENFTSDNGLTFNYIGFLAKDSIRYVSFSPQVTKLESGQGNLMYQRLFEFKRWFVQQLSASLKQPLGALASGILLGTKQSLGEELLTAFKRAGLVHIVVLSGFNVTIIADAIRRLFHGLPPTMSMALSSFSIVAFAIMTGASATTVRASIMAIIAVVALRSARTYSVDRALVIACVGMVLQNPRILLYDPGFQLSFVATLGLLYGAPFVERFLTFVSETGGLRQIISTTIATQLAVLPLLVSMTGEISIISLVANVLVLPVVPFAMALSALLIFCNVLGIWSMPILLLTKGALLYMAEIALYLGSLPFAVLSL